MSLGTAQIEIMMLSIQVPIVIDQALKHGASMPKAIRLKTALLIA